MKQIISFIICSFTILFANAQTISPVQTTEFCPSTEYTFTVSIPKTYSSMIGEGGSFITQSPTFPVGSTFTFKGKFGDANQKQIFRIYYTDGTNYGFEFTKIKSLFYSTTSTAFPPCNVIKPNQVQPIIFPRCQVANATISFPNIQWFTNFENPEICFGSVTDYEYQLPAGWSIGSSVSNGSNWIAGGNSVVVTSDLSSGDGADIRIRASNKTCGTGLAANGPVSSVRISRPEPTMSISPSGNQAFVCANSNKTFTINGLPANAVVTSWATSDPSLATVPNPSPGGSVVVTNVGGDGSVILTANISQCNYTYQRAVVINLGTNVPAVYSISSNYVSSSNNQYQYYTNPYPYGLGQVYQPKNQNVLFYSTIDNSFITNPSWSVSGTYNLFYSSPNSFSLYMTTPNSGSYTRNTATVRLLANSGCGSIDKRYILEAIVSGYSFSMTASPNPAKGNINLTITKTFDTSSSLAKNQSLAKAKVSTNKTILSLYDVNSNILIKQWSYNETDATNYNLNIIGVKTGWYVLKMDRDNSVKTTKIFIQ
ncbi:MAG TPA: T9SS type A sorting domain-containing protein [Clostridia bacterium]|nr:T9SS type A sorting domain-containing protein [Clostridia bacterium]